MRCCFARNQSSDLNGFRRIFLVATLEILEEIFNKEWPELEMFWIHGGHGLSEFKRMLNGIIFLGCFARCFGVAKTYDF